MPKHVQVREYVRGLVREAQPGTAAPSERELVQRFRTGPDAAVFAAPRTLAPLAPVIDVEFAFADTTLRWFSVISTIGTPIDVTAQELRLEAFFPSDEETATRWSNLAPTP